MSVFEKVEAANKQAVSSWAKAIRRSLMKGGRPGERLVVHNPGAPRFRLRALYDRTPISDEFMAEAARRHLPVVAHLVFEELARTGIAAHLYEQPNIDTSAWQVLSLRMIDTDIDYSGYDSSPDGPFLFRIALDLDLVVRKPEATRTNPGEIDL